MKRICTLIISLLILKNSYSQTGTNIERKSANYFIGHNNVDTISKLYIADNSLIDSIIKIPSKKFKIVIFFSNWCGSCIEKLPVILDFLKQNDQHFDVSLISLSPYCKVQNEINFINNYLHYKGKVFVMDEIKYKTQKRNSSKLNAIIKQICPNCDYKRIGYSSFIVYDSIGNYLLHSTYYTNGLERVVQLKKIL
jgi:thiol-disulfide isomerase/thioredoxin